MDHLENIDVFCSSIMDQKMEEPIRKKSTLPSEFFSSENTDKSEDEDDCSQEGDIDKPAEKLEQCLFKLSLFTEMNHRQES